jgi:hypothetical protein
VFQGDLIKKLNIQSFNTAEELFVFTTYEVKDNAMKTAYYKALLKKFYNHPQARRWCALTSINLAMLYIDDNRRPTPQNTRLALENLELIAKSYPEEKEYCARSLWLCGWIYQDILNDFENARPYYEKVIQEYRTIPSNNGSESSWGAISALQILKMSPKEVLKEKLDEMLLLFGSDIAATYAIHYSMETLSDSDFINIALIHMHNGYHHAVKTSQIIYRAYTLCSDDKTKNKFKNFILDKFKDFPTIEVKKIITAVSNENKGVQND